MVFGWMHGFWMDGWIGKHGCRHAWTHACMLYSGDACQNICPKVYVCTSGDPVQYRILASNKLIQVLETTDSAPIARP